MVQQGHHLVLDAGDARVAGPGHRRRLELPEEPVTVLGDVERLHQVLTNRLDNARRHTPAGSTVVVRVGTRVREGRWVELSVSDDGPGISEELLPEIFERFVRADEGRSRASGGSGLGLAIVRAVALAHGGSVEVESKPGHTVFRVLLPRGEDSYPPG
ncbi:sensor histidine kinase [Sphaerisporangium fuscum]|uniref:sensor histidine kinase n=1 Tax=Sphaerisporangium fuscum TaxID=2835868 RepID=UPI001BDC330F|nr:ATP-binding protein [Sphaerisporangium fuscum]